MQNLRGKEYPFLIQKEVEINGVIYILQRIPFKFYMELNDRCMGSNGVLKQAPYIEELLKHVCISPKVTLADFEYDYVSGMELVKEIETFLKSKPDKDTNKEESEG